jgi:predicted HicB family RNase H-like nuclease
MSKQEPTKTYPKPLSIRVDDALRAELTALAATEDRSLGNLAKLLIREALEARKKQKKG